VSANNTEEITAGRGSIKGKLDTINTMKNFPLSVPTLVLHGEAALFLDDVMYAVKVHTMPKTYAKVAAGPPVPLHPKLVAKTQLHISVRTASFSSPKTLLTTWIYRELYPRTHFV